VVVLVSGNARKTPHTEQYGDLSDLPPVEVDVWDMERMFRVAAAGLTYESHTIDLQEMLGEALPCLVAPEGKDHRCYLAIFTGELLSDLYQKYGASLLELNVRSFLQARGKVNRGLRKTLKEEPQHFLAYNNGISVTADKVDVVDGPDGGKGIRRLIGMQIVNGGQTVASIHRAKTRDRSDISGVRVQAKVTEVESVESEKLADLVSDISRYANTQNKVNEVDFSANHPFHWQVQKLSEDEWVPGETSRWFYERARGSWEVQRSREGTTPAKLKAFDLKLPKKQRVDKLLLAKAYNAWAQLPHVVSLGGQKNFVHFMAARVPEEDDTKDYMPGADRPYYRHLIAKVIILKAAETIGRQLRFSAYTANAVCYTVSLLAYRTASRVNLDSIWNVQDISEALSDTLRAWMPQIHEEIIRSADDRNVTEWCKKQACWTHIQSLPLELGSGVRDELKKGVNLPNVGKWKKGGAGTGKELSPEEQGRQELVMRFDATEWVRVVKWALERGEFEKIALDVAGTLVSYAAMDWASVPSPKQTKHVVPILDEWVAWKKKNEVEGPE
jgi:hypothetical protein